MSNPKDLVGSKKAPLRYVPPALAIAASGPMEDGAIKYGPFNWREQPVEVLTYIEAVFRHLYAYLDGQDDAEDSGHSHIDHAIAGLGIIADARAHGSLIDNRYAKGPAAGMLRERDKTSPNFDPTIAAWGPFTRLGKGPSYDVTVEDWSTGEGPIIRLNDLAPIPDPCTPETCCASSGAVPHAGYCRWCNVHEPRQ